MACADGLRLDPLTPSSPQTGGRLQNVRTWRLLLSLIVLHMFYTMGAPMGSYTGGNTTGFVSPAGDSLEGPIDLSEILDLRRPSRYPVRVAGEALAGRGILPGDILIADAAAPPAPGKVAVVMLAGDVLIAQLTWRNGLWQLLSGRVGTEPLPVEGDDAEIWAIITGLVRTQV